MCRYQCLREGAERCDDTNALRRVIAESGVTIAAAVTSVPENGVPEDSQVVRVRDNLLPLFERFADRLFGVSVDCLCRGRSGCV